LTTAKLVSSSNISVLTAVIPARFLRRFLIKKIKAAAPEVAPTAPPIIPIGAPPLEAACATGLAFSGNLAVAAASDVSTSVNLTPWSVFSNSTAGLETGTPST